ncbi:hypothetical protein Tco_0115571, partial [Tanacetum coccineum]
MLPTCCFNIRTEAFEDDSSKQGRKLFHEEVQEKASTEKTELFIQEVTPTEVIHEQEGSGKASDEVSTTGKKKGTARITDFKGMSYNEIRPIFEKLWDFNQKFMPMDAEKGSKKQMSPEKEKSPEKERSPEKIVEEKVVTQEEKEEVVKEPGAK